MKMLDKDKFIMTPEYWMELTTWVVMILVIIFIRFLPNSIINSLEVYMLIGGIISFALLYYLVIYRYFIRTQRLWIKDISDIIIISVLIILARDYGTYIFALYFLPIAAATLVLGTINSLLIALIACLFVILEVFMGAEGFFPRQSQFTVGAFQIAFIILITVFCQFLALQIRQEKRARAEAEARAEAREISEKRERDFMTMTSHQLMTPLSIIRGFSSILDIDKKNHFTNTERDYVQEIHNNSKKMVALVKELMTVSKINSDGDRFKMKMNPLEPIIKNVVNNLQPVAERKKITIEFEKPKEKIPEVYIDPEKMEQVICNMITNAIKYSEKGKVHITCNMKHVTNENQKSKVKNQNDNEKLKNREIMISVSDTGVGIAREEQEKVFTPFFRSKKTFGEEGTGLGLYIAKMIVEHHGGKMWFTSEPGKGSVFSFSLPIKKG
jgi:signal transduction histidine kinase